MIYLI
jgi:14-3-3 protein epsilon